MRRILALADRVVTGRISGRDQSAFAGSREKASDHRHGAFAIDPTASSFWARSATAATAFRQRALVRSNLERRLESERLRSIRRRHGQITCVVFCPCVIVMRFPIWTAPIS
jgi:hypothetical protein